MDRLRESWAVGNVRPAVAQHAAWAAGTEGDEQAMGFAGARTTRIVAWERLLVTVDSAVAPPTTARLTNWVPVVSGISETMIVTVSPDLMFPSWQMMSLPMLHCPLEGWA